MYLQCCWLGTLLNTSAAWNTAEVWAGWCSRLQQARPQPLQLWSPFPSRLWLPDWALSKRVIIDWQAGIRIVIRMFSFLQSSSQLLAFDPDGLCLHLFHSQKKPFLYNLAKGDIVAVETSCGRPELPKLVITLRVKWEGRFDWNEWARLMTPPLHGFLVSQLWNEPRWNWEHLRDQRPWDS